MTSLVYFDQNPWLDAANQLMEADEPERALKLLDTLPGYYRDNPTPEILELKAEITKALFTVQDYMRVDGDLPKSDEAAVNWVHGTMRGSVILNDLTEANKDNKKIHITDYGPGDYMLPIGLKKLGLTFNYSPILLEKRAHVSVVEQNRIPSGMRESTFNQEDWFVAFEIIEHLWNPKDIAVWAHRGKGLFPDRIYLSTPKYTFNRGCLDWRTKKQPHLRTYTPREFEIEAQSLFPNYNWSFFDDPVMVLKGVRK